MTWLLTSTGRQHYLTGPKANGPANVPGITEIAHSLAQINRYTGHCERPYSVAEHSLLCASYAKAMNMTPLAQLVVLMHDAHECITGDVASPVKQVLGTMWHHFEDTQQSHLLAHYGLLDASLAHQHLIRHCDLVALATERRDLLPFDAAVHDPWPVIDTYGCEVKPWDAVNLMSHSQIEPFAPWSAWRRQFVEKFHALRAQVAAQTTP